MPPTPALPRSFDRGDQPGIDRHLSGQQILRVGLALGINLERSCSATPETLMEQEVQGEKVRNLEAINASMDDSREAVLNERLSDRFEHPCVDLRRSTNHTNIGRIALVSRSP